MSSRQPLAPVGGLLNRVKFSDVRFVFMRCAETNSDIPGVSEDEFDNGWDTLPDAPELPEAWTDLLWMPDGLTQYGFESIRDLVDQARGNKVPNVYYLLSSGLPGSVQTLQELSRRGLFDFAGGKSLPVLVDPRIADCINWTFDYVPDLIDSDKGCTYRYPQYRGGFDEEDFGDFVGEHVVDYSDVHYLPLANLRCGSLEDKLADMKLGEARVPAATRLASGFRLTLYRMACRVADEENAKRAAYAARAGKEDPSWERPSVVVCTHPNTLRFILQRWRWDGVADRGFLALKSRSLDALMVRFEPVVDRGLLAQGDGPMLDCDFPIEVDPAMTRVFRRRFWALEEREPGEPDPYMAHLEFIREVEKVNMRFMDVYPDVVEYLLSYPILEDMVGLGSEEASVKSEEEAASVKRESPNIKTESPYIKTESPYIKTESPNVKTESPRVKRESPSVERESPGVKSESVVVKMEGSVD